LKLWPRRKPKTWPEVDRRKPENAALREQHTQTKQDLATVRAINAEVAQTNGENAQRIARLRAIARIRQ
jgi:hypothetical protein